MKVLIGDVNLQVRNDNKLGNKFKSNVGVPQGDCLSPILFTFYLANSLKENSEVDLNADRNYAKKSSGEININ